MLRGKSPAILCFAEADHKTLASVVSFCSLEYTCLFVPDQASFDCLPLPVSGILLFRYHDVNLCRFRFIKHSLKVQLSSGIVHT
jgi:hypothetical protein